MKNIKSINEYFKNGEEPKFTLNDLENAYNAGYDSKEGYIAHDEEDNPYVEYNSYSTFVKWLESYKKII